MRNFITEVMYGLCGCRKTFNNLSHQLACAIEQYDVIKCENVRLMEKDKRNTDALKASKANREELYAETCKLRNELKDEKAKNEKLEVEYDKAVVALTKKIEENERLAVAVKNAERVADRNRKRFSRLKRRTEAITGTVITVEEEEGNEQQNG